MDIAEYEEIPKSYKGKDAVHELSKAQQRAYDKLTDKWRDAYTLNERLDTLDILVTKNLAESYIAWGAEFSPRSETYYRRKKV